MKRLLFLILLLATAVSAQQTQIKPDCELGLDARVDANVLTSGATSPAFDNRLIGCTTWQFIYSTTSPTAITAVSVEFDAAPNAAGAAGTFAVWPDLASGSVLPLTNTTGGGATGYKFQPWVQIKLNSATGTGQIRGKLYGWKPRDNTNVNTAPGSGAGTGAGATQVQGTAAVSTAPVGNPLYNGCEFRTTPGTITNGQMGALQCSNIQNLLMNPRVEAGGSGSGSDGVSDSQTLGSFLDNNGSPRRIAVRNEYYNPLTPGWDRPRTVTNSTDSPGTGIGAVGLLGQFDDASPSTVTENQFGNARIDSQRIIRVNFEGMKATYHCAGILTPAATPTDVIQITGSASKTVRILNVSVTVESTTAGVADVILNRKNAADTGGTSTAPTIGKNDSGSAAATAVCTVYTANPTVNGLVAAVGARKASGTQGIASTFDFATRAGQAMVLRGTSEFLAINGNGDTLLTGEVWAYDIEWTEE